MTFKFQPSVSKRSPRDMQNSASRKIVHHRDHWHAYSVVAPLFFHRHYLHHHRHRQRHRRDHQQSCRPNHRYHTHNHKFREETIQSCAFQFIIVTIDDHQTDSIHQRHVLQEHQGRQTSEKCSSVPCYSLSCSDCFVHAPSACCFGLKASDFTERLLETAMTAAYSKDQ